MLIVVNEMSIFHHYTWSFTSEGISLIDNLTLLFPLVRLEHICSMIRDCRCVVDKFTTIFSDKINSLVLLYFCWRRKERNASHQFFYGFFPLLLMLTMQRILQIIRTVAFSDLTASSSSWRAHKSRNTTLEWKWLAVPPSKVQFRRWFVFHRLVSSQRTYPNEVYRHLNLPFKIPMNHPHPAISALQVHFLLHQPFKFPNSVHQRIRLSSRWRQRRKRRHWIAISLWLLELLSPYRSSHFCP